MLLKFLINNKAFVTGSFLLSIIDSCMCKSTWSAKYICILVPVDNTSSTEFNYKYFNKVQIDENTATYLSEKADLQVIFYKVIEPRHRLPLHYINSKSVVPFIKIVMSIVSPLIDYKLKSNHWTEIFTKKAYITSLTNEQQFKMFNSYGYQMICVK